MLAVSHPYAVVGQYWDQLGECHHSQPELHLAEMLQVRHPSCCAPGPALVFPLWPQSCKQRAPSKAPSPTAPAHWRPPSLHQGGQTPVVVVAVVPCCCHPTLLMPGVPWLLCTHSKSKETLGGVQVSLQTRGWGATPHCPPGLAHMGHPEGSPGCKGPTLPSVAPSSPMPSPSPSAFVVAGSHRGADTAEHRARVSAALGLRGVDGEVSPCPQLEALSPRLAHPTPAWGPTPAPVGKRTKSLRCSAGHGGGSGGSGAAPVAPAAASGCGFPEDASLSLQGDALSPAGSDAAVLPALSATLGL